MFSLSYFSCRWLLCEEGVSPKPKSSGDDQRFQQICVNIDQMNDVYELNMPPAAHSQTEVTTAHVWGQRVALVSNMSLQIRLSQYILCINEHAVCVSSARRLIPSDFFRWPVRKPRKICSSAYNQLWPYVLPTIPIEKSSLYPPEVHSINLVKRIQRIKKKKNWHKTEDREQMASQAVSPSTQRERRTGTR